MKEKCFNCGKYAKAKCCIDSTFAGCRIVFCGIKCGYNFQMESKAKDISYVDLLRLKVKEGILTEADVERYVDKDILFADLSVC